MGAACYLCEHQYGLIPGQSAGDAVGACKLCGVLACLAHGMRDKSRPAYVCGCCVVGLLTVAAGKTSGGAGDSPAGPGPGAGDDRDPTEGTPSGFAIWAQGIEDVEDLIGDLAEERWTWLRHDATYLSELLAGPDTPASLKAYARPGAARARALMGAAAALATQLNLPESELAPALQHVVQEVRRV
ncbi:hypothetical protein [Hydrogenophaga sp.]|jgi:hypothetical protein|uniref:hypothetical protein n=1 Tax=Hydrogenophaga sp. TaxID=1904254 RepID=UPI002634F6BC|nr:hypothetical protein [Hydrogenophaga sp.]